MTSLLTLTLNPAVDVSTRTQRLVPSHKLRCEAVQRHPGGGGINVARVAMRLGMRVQAVFPAGGSSGGQLQDLMRAESVPFEALPIEGETRENFTVLEAGSGHEFRFVLPGPALTDAQWHACIDRVLALADAGSWVVASGSLPPGVPPTAYGELARELAARRVPLALDTSGAGLAAGLAAGVHLCKPSLRELEELRGEALPDEAAQLRACRDLVERGASALVALSLGAQGAMLVSREGAWRAAALSVAVAGTIGAGDSFLGGLLWALDRGDPAPEALAEAMAASAAALLAPGTTLCRPEDVRRLRPQVVVRSI
ncbi:1-phosphofructokinase family hexose kinase [Ramlibacter rhizophilus]|uniref:Phosphofructokinase n=1 Tax=Ramlibacter rhizophilus TaxID=1781167 RepID=A0A4Z0BZI1_9BURK|nr:1-phosphofructokinase family hexose kinase [Ramlibacter rhizophilus]TFZ04381.1 1-phosphofructokinase family hexose kinase [Ramlibacter rhizophilus]